MTDWVGVTDRFDVTGWVDETDWALEPPALRKGPASAMRARLPGAMDWAIDFYCRIQSSGQSGPYSGGWALFKESGDCLFS